MQRKELSGTNGSLGMGREDFALDFIYLCDACLSFLEFSNYVVKETNMGKCGRNQNILGAQTQEWLTAWRKCHNGDGGWQGAVRWIGMF